MHEFLILMYCKLVYFYLSFICKYAIQPLTRSYKICIYIYIFFRPSKGNLSLFEIARVLRITKVRILLIPLFIPFLNPKILDFLYSTKNNLT